MPHGHAAAVGESNTSRTGSAGSAMRSHSAAIVYSWTSSFSAASPVRGAAYISSRLSTIAPGFAPWRSTARAT